jgi:acyl-CoA hydrolase
MIDFGPFVQPGDGVWWGQAAAEPRPLVDALLDQSPQIGPIRVFTGLSWNERLALTVADRVSVVSYGGLGELRVLSWSGRLEIVPCHYSALPRMFAERRLPCDVGLIQVSPPDADGLCSLGIGVDYVADALRHTPVLIAEINQQMPKPLVPRAFPSIGSRPPSSPTVHWPRIRYAPRDMWIGSSRRASSNSSTTAILSN